MAVTQEQVKQLLTAEEVDYPAAALMLGADALPHLRELIASDDPMLASKAAYLAGTIDAGDSADIVATAAASDQVVVRIAAANALENVTGADASVFEGLLDDLDAGVRRAAVKAVGVAGRADLRINLERLADEDTAPMIRDLAKATADQLG
jgi:hypothetical protein